MTSPWLKFYPTDWRADQALRICSLGARGLWMEMLCLMHEAQPRGSLLINGQPINERQLASLAGRSLKEVGGFMSELEMAGVFSRDPDGVVYSRRMRRDEAKAEKDKANGKSGGNPKLLSDNRGVNPRLNGEDKAQKPEARTQTIDNINLNNLARDFKPFPPDGSIAYSSPYVEIARKHAKGADPDIFASAFRKYCHGEGIPFDDPLIARKFNTFCGKHKVQGLHS